MAMWKKSFRLAASGLLFIILLWPRPGASVEAALRQILLTVRINGELAAENALLLESEDGRLSARVADLRDWRLSPPGSRFRYEGEEFAPLDAFPGLSYRVDPATLELDIDAPIGLFDRTLLFGPRERLPPQGGTGAYLNYDFLHNVGDGTKPSLGGVIELVGFHTPDLGVLENTVLAEDLIEKFRIFRLENTWTKDLLDQRQSVRLGDSFTAASALSRPLRFGGIQWATNFAVDPTFITFPTESIAGLAERPSVVEVFIDDALRSTARVPRGPFQIDRLPSVSGQGEVRLVVTDILGREQEIVQSFYFSPTNLAAGVSDFSFEAGFERKNFALADFDYGAAFFSGTYRYGFTDRLTAEGHVELQRDQRVGGASGNLVVPGVGRFGARLLGSSGPGGSGFRSGFSYDYNNSRFNLGLSTEYASAGFRQLGLAGDSPSTARTDQARFGVSLGDLGSLGVSFIQQENRDIEDRSILSGSYQVNLGFGTLLINGTRNFEPESDSAISARFVVPLGNSRTVVAGANRESNRRRANLEYQQGLGASDIGVDYRLRAERDEDRNRLDGNLTWLSEKARVTMAAARIDENDSARFGMSGGLAIMGGDAFLSRRIDRSFAVVDTGGIEGITVYLENREVGRTDSGGRIMVPGLGAYRANQFRLEPSDIPLDATVSNLKVLAAPYFRSGIIVDFPVKLTRSATVTVLDETGAALPGGSVVRSEDGVSEGRIANGGLAYLTDLGVGEMRFIVRAGDKECSFTTEIPENLGVLPDLGEVECR